MIKRITVFSSLALLLCTFLLIMALFGVREKDYVSYDAFMNKTASLSQKETVFKEKIEQKRREVQKHIYNDALKMQAFILCKNSTWTLIPSSTKFFLKEELEDVEGWILDEKKEANLKSFHAKKGLYDYKNHKLFLNDLHISFYKHANDVNLSYLEGFSDQATMILDPHSLSFTAENFHADITP